MRTERFTVNGLEVTAQFDPRDIDHIYIPLLHNLSDLQKRLGRRIVCFLAGPPASGKSTLCLFLERLGRDLGMNVQSAGIDGFHYPQDYLNAHTLGDTPLAKIKGAPETFDVEGLRVALCALRDGKSVSWPLYDRRLHDVVENALYASAPILLVEGNWLLRDAPAWQGLPHDWAIFLSAEESQLRERLIARKMRGGRTEAEARAFYDACDGPNVRLCLQRRLPADEQWRMLDTGRFARE